MAEDQLEKPQTRAGRRPDQRADRRIQRTKDALRDALLDMLPEVGWDDIDVAMLCERANIGRSTFYLHYSDKSALLRGAFEDLRQYLTMPLAPAGQLRVFAFLPGLLAHVHEQQAVFRALLGRRSGQVVHEHMRDMLIALFSQGSAAAVPPTSPTAARAHMLAGSLMQLMVWWLGSAWQLSPEEIEARFLAFAVNTPA
jgi:AcrR family transcriptional regulator